VKQGNGDIRLRPAKLQDFDFAWSLYRKLMKPLTEELLKWNDKGQEGAIREALENDGTSVIVGDGSDAGWLRTIDGPDAIYLGHLNLQPSLQNRGVGTILMKEMCDTAGKQGKAVRLDVMKNNRARTFYERLGFRVIGQSDNKLSMEWRPVRN